jgi:hypothetical protein
MSTTTLNRTQRRRCGNCWDVRKLAKMYREIHGRHWRDFTLADDMTGRAWLTAMLSCGLNPEEALERRAPWIQPAELQRLQAAARRLAFDDIGASIKLTADQWEHFRAWRFWPCDISREEGERRRRQRRRDKDRIKRQENRAKKRGLSTGDRRADSVLSILKASGPTTLPDLVRRAKHSPAFPAIYPCPAMPELAERRRNMLRKLVHRAVKRLAELGLVETEARRGNHGPVLHVQLHAKRTELSRSERDTSVSRSVKPEKLEKRQCTMNLRLVFEAATPVRIASVGRRQPYPHISPRGTKGWLSEGSWTPEEETVLHIPVSWGGETGMQGMVRLLASTTLMRGGVKVRT